MSDAEFEVYYKKCKKQMLIAILTSPLWLWLVPFNMLRDLVYGRDDEVLAKGRKESLFFAILTSPLWLWTITIFLLICYATGDYFCVW